jgi:hypothetical protein
MFIEALPFRLLLRVDTHAICLSVLQDVHWTRVFTDRINNSTKLVGPTISCEGELWLPATLVG